MSRKLLEIKRIVEPSAETASHPDPCPAPPPDPQPPQPPQPLVRLRGGGAGVCPLLWAPVSQDTVRRWGGAMQMRPGGGAVAAASAAAGEGQLEAGAR